MLAAACGSRDSTSRAAPVDRCTQRILSRAEVSRGVAEHRAEAERYVRTTYCARFAREGWVYEDGTLAIGAYKAVSSGGTCGTSRAGEPMRTVPCDQLNEPGPNTLDCALLHFVRRAEVQAYLRRAASGGTVSCDDGTPLEDLGA
jgi:hypothetical protein